MQRGPSLPLQSCSVGMLTIQRSNRAIQSDCCALGRVSTAGLCLLMAVLSYCSASKRWTAYQHLKKLLLTTGTGRCPVDQDVKLTRRRAIATEFCTGGNSTSMRVNHSDPEASVRGFLLWLLSSPPSPLGRFLSPFIRAVAS